MIWLVSPEITRLFFKDKFSVQYYTLLWKSLGSMRRKRRTSIISFQYDFCEFSSEQKISRHRRRSISHSKSKNAEYKSGRERGRAVTVSSQLYRIQSLIRTV